MRLILSLLLVLLAFLLSFTRIYAQSPDSCNNFESIQSVILSEATRQPFDAQLEVARVAVTHGACNLDARFYTGYGIAQQVLRASSSQCLYNTHCRAYFLLYTIDPSVRESAALASYVALTEYPRIPRYHFDNALSTAYWWDSPRACPHGWFIIYDLKAC